MGMVCENCGWRENPNDNTGKICIFSKNKNNKKWNYNGYNSPCDNYITDTTLREHLKTMLDIKNSDEVKMVNKISNETRWINVKDEMPEDNVPVIICTEGINGKIIMEARYSESLKKYFSPSCLPIEDYGADRPVTHWMPLPEPPEN